VLSEDRLPAKTACGGSFKFGPESSVADDRGSFGAAERQADIGFRVVRTKND